MQDKQTTTIRVDKEVREELKLLGIKGEDYDSIIKKTINFTKKFNNEHEFSEWFKLNYYLFGFDKLIKEQKNATPDFILSRNGKKVRVELETLSGNFIIHKHNPADVDLVICLINNKKLPVETLEISPFDRGYDLECQERYHQK